MTTANALNINTVNASGVTYPDVQGGTNITVSRSGGTTTIIGTGGAVGALQSVNNLSDVASAPFSQNNLVKNSINTITNATALSADDCGKAFYCVGLNSYSISLPDPSTVENQFIEFSCQMTNNPTLLDFNYLNLNTFGTGAKIAGQDNIGLTTGDAVRLVSYNGSWWIDKSWLQPINFLVNMTGTPNLPNLVVTTIPYNNIIRDTLDGFVTAEYAYYVPVPGLYELYHCTTIANGNYDGNYVEFTMFDAFSVPLNITSQQCSLPPQPISGSVANKKEIFVSNLNSKFSISGYQSTSSPINMDTTVSFFGGRRVSLF